MKYIRLFEKYRKPGIQNNDWILIKNPNDYVNNGEAVNLQPYSIFKVHTKGSFYIWCEFLPEYGYVNVDKKPDNKLRIIKINKEEILFSSRNRKEVEEEKQLLTNAKKYNV